MTKKIIKTEEEWHKQLTDEQYRITRQSGTEKPFTGQYWDNFEPGTYHCVCCGAPLFTADDKYDAGCGWPSFTKPIDTNAIEDRLDNSHQMQRIEVVCNKCEAHLGHVFTDGPKPSGLRYCINSASLKLNSEKDDS